MAIARACFALAFAAVNEFLWFAPAASLFSTGRTRRTYGRAKIRVDRVAGTCLALLGIRLALSERQGLPLEAADTQLSEK